MMQGTKEMLPLYLMIPPPNVDYGLPEFLPCRKSEKHLLRLLGIAHKENQYHKEYQCQA